MGNIRRYYIPNSLIFITCVTNNRIHYLQGEHNLSIFRSTLENVQKLHPFHLFAHVTLPDHFHWIMRLPEDDPNFSRVLHSFKFNFTWNLKRETGIDTSIKVWQSRFWDHVIRDEDDLKMHLDYIHWNPVKHGYAKSPEKWSESSFQFWLEKGIYGPEWFYKEPENLAKMNLE
jgi:putative transposase